MKLIQVQKPGPPGVMQLLDVPVPEPKPGEVLIRRTPSASACPIV